MPQAKPLKITRLHQVSPSLAEVIRNCPLQAGLNHNPAAAPFVLGYPQAWLGIAYHEVLSEFCTLSHRGTASDISVEALWQNAIDEQHSRIMKHPLDKRYGAPEHWPGYHLTLSGLGVAANRLNNLFKVDNFTTAHKQPTTGHDLDSEKQLSAFDALLVGRPDLYNSEEVIDFKTGAIAERASGEITLTDVKPGYIRQLRIYAFLVNGATGRWPRRAAIWPLGGAPLEFDIHPDECIQEAHRAVETLTTYNLKFSHAASALDMSSPSPSNCARCQFQILCSGFWENLNPDWLEALRAHAVEARLCAPIKSLYDGSSVLIPLEIIRGTVQLATCRLSPVPVAVHDNITELQTGDLLRIVGLPPNAEGTIIPSLRTVMIRGSQLPDLRICDR
jgi:hypothetical protein